MNSTYGSMASAIPGTVAYGGFFDDMFKQAAGSALGDPYEDVLVLENRIASMEQMGAPQILINPVRAKLQAARHALSQQQQSNVTQKSYTDAGKLTLYMGLGLLVVATIYIGRRI